MRVHQVPSSQSGSCSYSDSDVYHAVVYEFITGVVDISNEEAHKCEGLVQ